MAIRVAVLEGDYALLTRAGIPLPLGLQLQLEGLHPSKASWAAKSSPKGFSLNLFWPALSEPRPGARVRSQLVPNKPARRKRRRRRHPRSGTVDQDAEKTVNVRDRTRGVAIFAGGQSKSSPQAPPPTSPVKVATSPPPPRPCPDQSVEEDELRKSGVESTAWTLVQRKRNGLGRRSNSSFGSRSPTPSTSNTDSSSEKMPNVMKQPDVTPGILRVNNNVNPTLLITDRPRLSTPIASRTRIKLNKNVKKT